MDFARCEVRRGHDTIDLSALEFKLLTAFVRSRGRVLTREQLLDAAWGRDVSLNDRVVDNHIVSLRRKIDSGTDSMRDRCTTVTRPRTLTVQPVGRVQAKGDAAS